MVSCLCLFSFLLLVFSQLCLPAMSLEQIASHRLRRWGGWGGGTYRYGPCGYGGCGGGGGGWGNGGGYSSGGYGGAGPCGSGEHHSAEVYGCRGRR